MNTLAAITINRQPSIWFTVLRAFLAKRTTYKNGDYFKKNIEMWEQFTTSYMDTMFGMVDKSMNQSKAFKDQMDQVVNEAVSAQQEATMNTLKIIQGQMDDLSKKMDSLLVLAAKYPEKRREFTDAIRQSVPMSGHPTGYFMADAIMETGGKDEMLKHLGDPFVFFAQYDKAARSSEGKYPAFSNAAMALLFKIRDTYTHNKGV